MTTQSLWWTSDTHFGHAKIIQYCNRPFVSVEEMDAEMIRRWNAVVQLTDTTVVVGDFSFHAESRTQAILSELHGEKILVKGNHDRRKTDTYWRHVGFNKVLPHYHVTLDRLGRVLVQHEPQPYSPAWPVQFNGHVHDRWKTRQSQSTPQLWVNVGVDQWGFAPVSTQALVDLAHAEQSGLTG